MGSAAVGRLLARAMRPAVRSAMPSGGGVEVIDEVGEIAAPPAETGSAVPADPARRAVAGTADPTAVASVTTRTTFVAATPPLSSPSGPGPAGSAIPAENSPAAPPAAWVRPMPYAAAPAPPGTRRDAGPAASAPVPGALGTSASPTDPVVTTGVAALTPRVPALLASPTITAATNLAATVPGTTAPAATGSPARPRQPVAGAAAQPAPLLTPDRRRVPGAPPEPPWPDVPAYAEPTVHIEQIHVVTPPAPAPARDSFATLADRRRGRSRHASWR